MDGDFKPANGEISLNQSRAKINLAKVSWFWKFSLSSCVPPSEAQVNSDVSSIKPQSDDMMRGRMVMILKKKKQHTGWFF